MDVKTALEYLSTCDPNNQLVVENKNKNKTSIGGVGFIEINKRSFFDGFDWDQGKTFIRLEPPYNEVNYAPLLLAAKKIEKLNKKQKNNTKKLLELASLARNPSISRAEIKRKKCVLENEGIIDFGGAVDKLCLALKKIKTT